jgi:hypothetical protein
MSTPTERAEQSSAPGFVQLWKVIGQGVAPTALVTSLMVYFGWARTTVIYDVFGISSSVLDLTVQDYLLRSVGTTFRPLVVVLLVLLLLRPAHRVLIRWQSAAVHKRVLPFAFFAAGAFLVGVGLLGFLRILAYPVEWPIIPLSLGVGVLLISYVRTLRASAPPEPVADDPGSDEDGDTSGQTNVPEPLLLLQRVALAAIVVVTLFWSAAVFAQLDGVQTAERIAANPQSLPGVVVFAPRRLQLGGSSVLETTLPAEADPVFRYRYDGFRLLTRSDKRLFLLPARWRPGTHAVVLADEPTLRIEYYR